MVKLKEALNNGNWKLILEVGVAIFILGGIWFQLRDLPEAVKEAQTERIALAAQVATVSADLRVLVQKMDGFVTATDIRLNTMADALRENERDIRRLERKGD